MHPAGKSPHTQNRPPLQALYSAPLRTVAPIALLVLLCFSVWLAANAHWPGAVTALSLANVAILGGLLIAPRRRKVDLPGTLLCLSITGGCLLAVWLLDEASLPWALLVLMTNFFIVRSRIALPANLLLTAGLLLHPSALRDPLQPQALLVIALIFGLGFRFSRQLQGDRTHLEQLATMDALTGLPNRHALDITLSQRIMGHRESRFRYALLVLDIDHFKAVNDRYGHAAGDVVLSDLASILRHELRDEDRAFRFGGEEFVIFADTGSREALEHFAERIRLAVWKALRGPGGRITISLGGAMYAGEHSWQDWFARADAALYEAKHRGRNGVMVVG